jgi:hypothetical protein
MRRCYFLIFCFADSIFGSCVYIHYFYVFNKKVFMLLLFHPRRVLCLILYYKRPFMLKHSFLYINFMRLYEFLFSQMRHSQQLYCICNHIFFYFPIKRCISCKTWSMIDFY